MKDEEKHRIAQARLHARAALEQTVLQLEAAGCGPITAIMALAELAGVGILAVPQVHRAALVKEATSIIRSKARVHNGDGHLITIEGEPLEGGPPGRIEP